MRCTLAVLAAFALAASTSGAQAATPCHDAKGKTIKCTTTPAAAKPPVQCKDDKGRLRLCGTPGAKPVA